MLLYVAIEGNVIVIVVVIVFVDFSVAKARSLCSGARVLGTWRCLLWCRQAGTSGGVKVVCFCRCCCRCCFCQ